MKKDEIDVSTPLMKRRSFLKLTISTLAAMALNPTIALAFEDEYKYGLHYLTNKSLEFVIDEGRKKLFSENFFDFDNYSNTGLCRELMCKEFLKVKDQKYTIRCEGYEPTYFRRGDARHFFLLTFDEKPGFIPKSITNNNAEIEKLLQYNPTLEDPSFNLKTPFKDSGYKIITAIPQHIKCKFRKDLTLNNGDAIILDNSNNHLTSAVFDIENPDLFTLRLDNNGRIYTQEKNPDYILENTPESALSIFDSIKYANMTYDSIPKVFNHYVSK